MEYEPEPRTVEDMLADDLAATVREAAPLATRPAPQPVRLPSPPREPGTSQAQERVIVRHSPEIADLFAALAKAQAAEGYGDIEKSKTARVQSKKGEGSSYTYTYETLKDVIAATQPSLAAAGIAVLQLPFPGERSVTIRTMLTHSSGQWLYNDLSALIPMPDPQAVGSGITYLRRYALKAILGVAAEDEDDDGRKASGREPEGLPQPAPRRSAARPQDTTSAATPGPTSGTVAPSQPPPVAAMAPPVPSPERQPIGKIVALQTSATGALLVKLDSGFEAGTKDAELAKSLTTYEHLKATVELRTRPSSNPAKYMPQIEEVILRKRESV